ncbi:MAG: hypothetical protein A2541_01070 [Candidatus Taylorbacteria bacterium RIFOXYD2_FULL_36_9]|uniref:DUF5671 domain-containing protein n=1 Tax=Candidatus Taylorbacteria bacterium RIFOXYD2_FULL_36_9 TaxID=1802338 RepID=A0A1G2PF75_9BACT|nr:MAG: hypothetical protein A2541_01070 [Candidatus Taylorbacteria bacterium RIFOXYD2_FULL_36_9]
MKKILISFVTVSSFSLPFLALAAGPDLGYLGKLIIETTSLLRSILVLLVSLAVVWFIWNVVRYSMSKDLEKKGEAKDQMIWGIVAIAVIVSIWGLVALLQRAFLGNEGASRAPSNFEQMIPGGKI